MAERASLVRLEQEFDIEVNWRGFELHPETPKGGRDLSNLHPGRQNTDLMGYVQKFAASFGVNDLRSSKWLPNTRRALAMSEFARDQGKLDELRHLIMDAHWKEGLNIEDDAVLREMAAKAGLDADEALRAADSPEYEARVEDIRQEYKEVGTGGIPTFVFGEEKIEGCQPYDVLSAAALRAGAKPR